MYGDFKIRVEIGVPISELEKIEHFRKRYKVLNRSEAIRQLMQVGLMMEEKVGIAETWTSADVAEIKRQFETAQLVDYIGELPRDKFSAIYNIVKDEYSVRAKRK